MAIRIAFVGFNDDVIAATCAESEHPTPQPQALYFHELIEKISHKAEFVGICSLNSNDAFLERVNRKLAVAGRPKTADDKINEDAVIALMEKWGVNYLVLQVISRRILAWAIRRNVRTLPIFSTDMNVKTAGGRLNLYLLNRLINKPRIPIVGVRSLETSENYKKAGIKADKIFPWDWPLESDRPFHPSGDLALGHLICRWIDSPRRPAQSIMRFSLAARDTSGSKSAA